MVIDHGKQGVAVERDVYLPIARGLGDDASGNVQV
jgi:hypothetical protein